jgi:aminopeptidase N
VAPEANGIMLTQSRFADDDTAKIPTSWHVPVIEKTLGTGKIWHGVVSRAAPQTITMAKDAVPVVNAGQAGYFRTLYAPALFTRLADHFTRLSPEDQRHSAMPAIHRSAIFSPSPGRPRRKCNRLCF